MKKLDARGYACPHPVIMTKKQIAQEKPEELTVLVDNVTATENLSKMAEQLGFSAEVRENSPTDFEVVLKKVAEAQKESPTEDFIVVLSSDRLGVGEENFSKKVMEGFIYALTEQEQLPKYVICYNYGVRLTSEVESTIRDLKTLEEKGVEVLSCGLCLEHYGLKESLQVGSITNMYRICQLQCEYRAVKPS